MAIKFKYILLGLAVIIPPLALRAMADDDDSQSDLRENPEMEGFSAGYVMPAVDYPLFINLQANHIDLNGDDWTKLSAAINSAAKQRVNIVHIGDSHLQADMATAVTRQRLGEHYGSAGRALITPFKLAGTNEPYDYAITTESSVEQSRLLKTPWPTEMGFTGIAVRPIARNFNISIRANQPFDSIAVYYTGDALNVSDMGHCHIERPGLTSIALADTCSSIDLRFEAPKHVDIHGFNLIRGNGGIAYHVIGNNGATYGTYNGINGFADGVAELSPSLIVISLGTNEAFGKTSDLDLKSQISAMIGRLRKVCPDAKFLLTTPAECQRRTYRGKGRRRRRAGYAVNSNVKRLRQAIIDFGREEGIPVYDFYAVAGGDGSSAKWLHDGLMNKDRIHLLRPGYLLQGHLFTDALEEAISKR